MDSKIKELSDKYKKRIITLLFYYDNEEVRGYAIEPTRFQKSLAIGKSPKGEIYAGMDLVENCLLKDESDPRLSSEESKYDSLVFGVAQKLYDFVKSSSSDTAKIIEESKMEIENSGDAQIAALIRFHLHLDPEQMTDTEFYKRWAELDWVMRHEGLKK